MKLTACIVAVSFLFTTVSAPFAQSSSTRQADRSLWADRRKALEEKRKKNSDQLSAACGARLVAEPWSLVLGGCSVNSLKKKNKILFSISYHS